MDRPTVFTSLVLSESIVGIYVAGHDWNDVVGIFTWLARSSLSWQAISIRDVIFTSLALSESVVGIYVAGHLKHVDNPYIKANII